MKIRVLLFFFFIFPAVVMAQDFGLLLNQHVVLNGAENDTGFEYKAGIVPRFSKMIGDSSLFFISASVTATYSDNEFKIIPELLRAEYSALFGLWGLNIGRFLYADPLRFIANGLFDGIQLTHTSSMGRFGIGVWYTGFLYKNAANITMTEEDLRLHSNPFKFSNFADTYFAPRRIIASLDYEHQTIGEFLRLQAAVTGQFDLNDADEKLHSQYIVLKVGIPAGDLLFELGGGFNILNSVTPENDTFNFAFAGELGVYWAIPSVLRSRLSFNARTASGLIGDDPDGLFTAFNPITNKYFGEIFQARMTSLSILSLGYSARLSQAFGANITASYFMRHDLVTNNTFPFAGNDNDNFLLGAEIFAHLVWSPFSDLQFNLNGGAFIPALGDNWSNEKPVWRIGLSAVLAIF
jgi:hypothetical protein